jgi:hypothetical protein
MAKTREYIRQSESMFPGSEDFYVFVHKQVAAGKTVNRVAARRWIMSAYKRESLIRFGAKAIASDACALEKRAKHHTVKNATTSAAIGFSAEGKSITEAEAEFFYCRGIGVVMHRLLSARSSTYVYDKLAGVFMPSDAIVMPKGRGNGGTVRAIFDVLAARNATASEIASDRGVNVDSVRSVLSRFFLQGRVSKVGRAGPGSKELIWGLVKNPAQISCL